LVIDYEPISINFFGGFAINNVDGNGTVSVGEAQLTGLTSNTKFNMMSQVLDLIT
jgi:hypothetical protein